MLGSWTGILNVVQGTTATQSNPESQCKPYQNKVYLKDGKADSKVNVKLEELLNNQNNLGKVQRWRAHTSKLSTKLH